MGVNHIIDLTPVHRSGKCPWCATPVEFESIFTSLVPLCDACAVIQERSFPESEERRKWQQLYQARIPAGYLGAEPDKVPENLRPVLGWNPATHPGGIGVIGRSGIGKSHAIACLLHARKQPFRWWSGTEARDAANHAATADRDRHAANERWDQALRAPILVLDDISQGRMTEAWSSRLFDILETRHATSLPVFWTSQMELNELREKIIRQNGGDVHQAAAITRRLAQHALKVECVEKAPGIPSGPAEGFRQEAIRGAHTIRGAHNHFALSPTHAGS